MRANRLTASEPDDSIPAVKIFKEPVAKMMLTHTTLLYAKQERIAQ